MTALVPIPTAADLERAQLAATLARQEADALRPLVVQLFSALSDLHDLYTTPYPTDPEAVAWFEVASMEANGAALDALEAARPFLTSQHPTRPNRTTLLAVRAAKVEASQANLPVKVELAERLHATALKLGDGIARAMQWQGVAADRWPTIAAAMHGLVDRLCDAGANLNRLLPTTTECVCDARVTVNNTSIPCKTVNLPDASNYGYRCINCRNRYHWADRRDSRQPLPYGFWATARPGDRYRGDIGERLGLMEEGA